MSVFRCLRGGCYLGYIIKMVNRLVIRCEQLRYTGFAHELRKVTLFLCNENFRTMNVSRLEIR
jgi:hypothetical protein